MIDLNELLFFCNDYLKSSSFSDYCPNGLQVEGNYHIKKIVSGVSASLELFEQAQKEKADLILVHHGIIWGNQLRIKGVYKERVFFLLKHSISLLVYHLPLDAHPIIGNNAQVADRFFLKNRYSFGNYKGNNIGLIGEFEKSISFFEFKKLNQFIFQEKIIYYDFGPKQIKKIAIMTGAAANKISEVVELGCDAFITGEVSENIMHLAKEEKINFIAAGHYYTEKFGIQALGKLLKKEFNIIHKFIDIVNVV